MAAYKTDINLFKAAGGERAKSKHVSKTKRLMVVVVFVIILVAGAAAGLFFYAQKVNDQLQDAIDLEAAYGRTEKQTKEPLATLADVKEQIATQNAIEFIYSSNMWSPGMYSDLSEIELAALHQYIDQDETYYTHEFDFDENIESLLNKLKLVAYNENADDEYTARFMYSALYYMREMKSVFFDLPYQNIKYKDKEETGNYWYCYYRGKVIILLQYQGSGVADTDALADALQSQLRYTPEIPSEEIGYDDVSQVLLSYDETDVAPFSLIAPEDRPQMTYKAYRVSLGENEQDKNDFVILALNSKTVVERFIDAVDAVFEYHNTNDPYVAEAYRYIAENFYLTQETSDSGIDVQFHVTFSMNQSDYFHLKDVCDELYKTPYFGNVKEYGFPDKDSNDYISSLHMVFRLKNVAVDAIHNNAVSYFTQD